MNTDNDIILALMLGLAIMATLFILKWSSTLP